MLLDDDVKSESGSFVLEILENKAMDPNNKNIVAITHIETIEEILRSDLMNI